MIFYNGTNDPKIDYKKLDLNNSREIGLHCGTEDACKSLGYKYINKLDIDCTNACELDFDMADIWSSMELIKLLPSDIFDLDTKKSILNSMREVAGDIDKYKKYSQIIRNAFLDKGFTVIIYKNEVEDPGSKSAIVLTPDVINTLSESMNAKDAWLKQVKYNRKRLKGLPRVGFNPNAGNVEHSMKMFNHMNDIGDLSNNPISGPFGGDVSAPAGDGAGMSMGESLDESLQAGSAYMLKNTGELIKCDLVHPYLKADHQSNNYESIRELFLVHPNDLIWFYNHIENEDTKNLLKQIIQSVKANAEYYGIWHFEIFDDLEKSIHFNDTQAIDNSNDIEVLFELANQKVNQDFCRVRTSNIITAGNSRDIYFRIGSHGFNWFDLIWNVVYENRKWISSVTIIGDKQSRGESFVYSHNGEKIEEMKTDDFVNISGRPVFEKCDLQHGYNLNEFYKVINPIHLVSRNRLNYFDYIHENYIRSSRDYSDKFSSNSSIDSRDDNLFKYLNKLEDI